ncbi:hypothetical protein [Staphylococcus sp. 17KM0847]|uniref:hypothetical protein n=1 Tax=Staphylococcus sp. 17KM0847 TaxID=2583989 RepID=UPI0015DD353B|nr:hypothetical protein [Staphylococcus sp. 17KM0847]QLK85469.1 hypothetical protein FGL66_01495 [Staphylococcus sp. 17KM0847]
MNKTFKTLVTVIPVFLVPLILERKKFKKHPEVQKLTNLTVSTTKTAALKTGRTAISVKNHIVNSENKIKSHLQTKKRRHAHQKAMKQAAKIQREMRPENVHARGDALAKENRKDIQKLDKKLQKAIDKRHKVEEKAQSYRQKQMKKNMTKMQKHAKQVGFVPSQVDSKVEAYGDKLAKQNKKSLNKMDKKLQKAIDKRHKVEEKIRNQRQKAMKQQMAKAQKHASKSEATSGHNHLKSTRAERQHIKKLSQLQKASTSQTKQ